MIFYVGEPGFVNGDTNFRGLAIALSDKGSALWGYDADAVNPNYGDMYGLQNTMNVSTHKHLRSLPHEDGTYNEQSVLKSFAAKAAMNHPLAAPAGTSG